jgi:hypothetical protein
VHPSYILRVPAEARDEVYNQFVADLKIAAGFPQRP